MKKRSVAKLRQRLSDSAARPEQQSALVGDRNPRPQPLSQMLDKLFGEVMHVDDGFFDARLREPIEHMVDERFAGDLHQRLRHRVGQRAHPRAESGGQHHGAARRDFSGGAHLDLQRRHIGAVPGGERRQIRVSQRSLQIVPDARHVSQILRLVVAAFEPREYAEDF